MKKTLLLIVSCGLMIINSSAQVSGYTFNQETSTYTEITTGTVLGNTTTDDQRFLDPAVPLGSTTATTGPGFPIGFNFIYNGNTYDVFAVHANGWISFGQSALAPNAVDMQSTSYILPISTASTASGVLQNRVSVFGRNIAAQTGSVLRFDTIGLAPYRILVIQWKSYRRNGQTGENFNFQIRLYETLNVVEFAYGTVVVNTTAATAPQVGLRGSANTDYNNRSTTSDWSASTAGTANTASMAISNLIVPPSGLVFQWTPPVVYQYDAGIALINSPGSFAMPGTTNVSVTIENFGTQPLTDASIAWNVDGVLQTPHAFTNAGLAQNSIYGPITIGTYNFIIPGNHTIKTWTENPNGHADENNLNDTVSMNIYIQGYGAIPYYQNMDSTWINKLSSHDAPDGYWVNNPFTGNNSWRRDDDGASAAWTGTGGAYTPAGSSSTLHSARFHTNGTLTGTLGTMDLYLDFTPVGVKLLKFWHINTSGTDSLIISMSTDGGNNFSVLQKFNTATTWTQHQITLGASVSPDVLLRFVGKSNAGSTDIGLDEVQVTILAPDDAGIVSINSPGLITSGNVPVTVTIKDFGTDSLTAADIDWSVNGAVQSAYAYTNSPGLAPNATDGPVTIGSYNFNTGGYYTIKVWTSNPNGGTDGDHLNDTISKVVYVQSYAPIPFVEEFDNTWINKSGTRDVPSMFWTNTPATGNDSWRRDEDGASAAWTQPTQGAYTPTGANGTTHSAKFHTYYAPLGDTGKVDVYLDFTTIGTKVLKFWYINPSGTDSLGVWLSSDSGATFSLLQKYDVSTIWVENTITLGAATDPGTVIRFAAVSDYGNDDLGIDRVQVFIPAPNDVGISDMLLPVSGICGNVNDSVIVEITNYGTASQTNIPVVADITTPGGPVNLSATLPGPLASNASANLFLGFLNTTTAGTYNYTIYTDLSTDAVLSNDTIHQSTTTTTHLSVPHLDNFEGGTPLANWTTNFVTGNGHGNTSFVMYRTLSNINTTGTATMNKTVGAITNNSYFSFDYRVVSNAGNATTLRTDTFTFYMSPDCGVTKDIILKIDSSHHTPSNVMKHIVLPLSSYAGLQVIPSLYAKRGNTVTYNLDIDNVAISEPPVVNLGPDATFCTGSNITLDAGASAQGYTYTYNWHTLSHPASIATSQSITVDSSATYIVSVNNGYGLIAGDTIVIVENPTPSVSIGPDTTNCGPYTLDPGPGYATYTWSTGATSQTLDANQSGIYWVDVTNSFGCVARDSANITIIPLPISDAGPDQIACNIDTLFIINAFVANNDSLLWTSNGDGHFTDSVQLHPGYIAGPNDLLNGTVDLTLTAYANCDIVSSVFTLSISNTANAYAGSDIAICDGTGTQLSATGGTIYSWSPSTGLSDPNIANPIASPNATTTYTVQVISSCGSATDDVTVTVEYITAPYLGSDSIFCPDGSIVLDAGSGYDSYLWSNGATSQTITADTAGFGIGSFNIYVDVTSGVCTASDTVNITFNSCLGIAENMMEATVNIYPNPTDGKTNIVVQGLSSDAVLSIYNIQGQEAYTEKIGRISSTQIDLSNLPAGVYMVRIFNEKENILRKLVVR